MKIGINASFLRKPETGIGQVTFNFLEKLKGFQGEADFILYTQEPVAPEWSGSFEVKAFLPWWKRDDVPRQRLWEKQVAREAMKDGCDVFLSLYQSASDFSGYELKAKNSKLPKHVMIVHDIIPKLFPEYQSTLSRRWHWRGIERGIRGADHIVAVSQSTREDIETYFGIASERISVAALGLSPVFAAPASDEQVSETLARYGLERGYIYHGGGLEIRKNAQTVLEAYALLRGDRAAAQVPPLVISGQVHEETNPLATDVVRLIAELGLGDGVRLLGRVPEADLPPLYRGAGLFVYPSLYEGFGLPPVEAFSQSTPVIASCISSLPEVCGDAAILIDDPKEPEEIEVAMRRLLNDESLRSELGERGYRRAQDFSYDRFAREIIKQCSSL